MQLDELPPQVRLGVRAELMRVQMPVHPVVVIVSDVRSYVAAIGRWTTEGRFPVLIDDGTWEAREDIGRFVRGFAPQRIITWTAPADALWPAQTAEQQALIEKVTASVWGAKDWSDYPARLRAINAPASGIVVASMQDSAWTAALALAAGHGQTIAWVDSPNTNVSGELPLSVADAFSEKLGAAAEASGFTWKALGDDIDAVTLCVAMPARVRWNAPAGATSHPKGSLWPIPGEPVATTDVIGRHATGDHTERWAWAGQLWGTGPRAAYLAMSSLFIQPRRAWVFDSYESTQPWHLFDGGETAELIKRRRIPVDLDDSPAQSLADWRDRVAGSWKARPGQASEKDRKPVGCIDAGLIFVNTHGMSESFNLSPGQALSADIPFLDQPAAVYFVHSWSAQFPGSSSTIAGRWLERGVFAYVGSVHEPYLHAFQPTPSFVKRLLAPTALGVAARSDGAPPWRIAVFGDPLYTIGPSPREAKSEFPLAEAVELREALRPHLRDGKFEDAFANLVMCGRDADLIRVAKAALRQEPGKMSPGATMLTLGPALRRADLEAFLAAWSHLAATAPADFARPMVQDFAWHAIRPSAQQLAFEHVQLLGKSLRSGAFIRDAEDVALMLQRKSGDKARREFLEGVAATTKDPGLRVQVDKLLIGK